MSIEFWAAGSAVSGVDTTLALVAPTLNVNDIIIAQIISQDVDAHLAPDATWTAIQAEDNGIILRSSIWWKRAVAADSGATFTFTSFAGVTGNLGILTVYRGCKVEGSPIGTSTNSTNIAADDVTYATLTPLSNNGAVVACGFYGENATTAGAITGTAPTMTNVVDVEAVPAGFGLSLFQYWGKLGMGGATGALTNSTTSTTDAINNGMLFDLLADDRSGGSSGVGSVAYPRVTRTR